MFFYGFYSLESLLTFLLLGGKHRGGWDGKDKALRPILTWKGKKNCMWVWDRGRALCPRRDQFRTGELQRINMAIKKSRELWSQQRDVSAVP